MAARAGRVRTVEIDIAVAGSSLHADGYDGRAVMVVDTAREVLVGVTFVGQDVSDRMVQFAPGPSGAASRHDPDYMVDRLKAARTNEAGAFTVRGKKPMPILASSRANKS